MLPPPLLLTRRQLVGPVLTLPTPVPLMSRRALCFPFHSAVIGEVDDDKDSAIDYSQVRALPLKPVTH